MTELEKLDAELKSANDMVTKWAGDVRAAETALNNLRSSAGRLAVAGHGAKLATDLRDLENQVFIAQAALVEATANRDRVQALRQRAWTVQLRADADELDRQAEAFGLEINELTPRLNSAHEQLKYTLLRSSTLRRQADQIDDELRGKS